MSSLDRNHDGKVDLKDLDRNHDGRIDARDFQGQSTVQIATTPIKTEVIQKDVVVHEHIHPVQKEEIQPVIYREREQLDVKQVTQLMHETQIQPTLVQQRELAAEVRAPIVERGAPIAENYVAPSRDIDATARSQVVHAPIVNEVIKKTVVEEIQPVLERDVITSTIIQETKPIYEKIIEAPHVHRETTIVHDRGIVGGDISALQAQGFNLGATGQRLSQGYSSNPLDRNHDGRVDARDFVGQPGLGQTGYVQGQTTTVHHSHNPLDRNHDGRVDSRDFTGQPGLGQTALGQGQTGLAGETLLTHRGLQQPGAVHHNPLDRNHDGKVDLKDLSGRQTTQNTI